MAGSAVVGRVADIASGCVSDEKRSEPLLKPDGLLKHYERKAA